MRGAGIAALATLAPWARITPAFAAPTADRVLATGLKIPWGLVFVGSDALVSERDTCAVYRVAATGGSTLVGTVPGVVKVMSMALSPSFTTDRLIYAYGQTGADNRVVRFTYDGSTLGSAVPVFTGIPVGTDHPGGALAFGPDGFLYVGVGDLGTAALAQDLSSLGGKILRLRADGSVPGDNPFGTAVWTYGHRNLEGFAFDGTTLYATEFGESTTDELNVVVRGADYGWPTIEGGDGSGPVQDPVATWSPTASCSPSGLAITGGQAFIGALAGTALFQVDLASARPASSTRYFFGTYGRIRTVALAPDGSLWITTGNNSTSFPHVADDDRVIRILPGLTAGQAPTGVSATVISSTSVSLAWSPPTSGGTVTGYVVSRDAGTAGGTTYSTTVSATTRSFTFGRLTPGSTYQLTVAAVTAAGVGPAAVVSATPGASTLPSAPTSVTAVVVSDTSASLGWAPPTSDGGSTITGYRVTRDGGAGYTTTVSATTRSFTFGRLTAGQTYTLSVAAITAVGTGAAASTSVVPGTGLPSAPTSVAAAVLSDTSASLGWAPPTSDGGSTITGYRVTRDGGAGYTTTVSATTRSFTFGRLTAGQTYTLSVAAITAVGTGAAASANVVPAGVPAAPTIGTAAAGTAGGAITATARWSAPASTGGSAITGYRVRALRISSSGTVLATTVSALQPAAARSLVMTLSPAGNYRFTVEAVNAVGTSPVSARSNQVAAR